MPISCSKSRFVLAVAVSVAIHIYLVWSEVGAARHGSIGDSGSESLVWVSAGAPLPPETERIAAATQRVHRRRPAVKLDPVTHATTQSRRASGGQSDPYFEYLYEVIDEQRSYIEGSGLSSGDSVEVEFVIAASGRVQEIKLLADRSRLQSGDEVLAGLGQITGFKPVPSRILDRDKRLRVVLPIEFGEL